MILKFVAEVLQVIKLDEQIQVQLKLKYALIRCS